MGIPRTTWGPLTPMPIQVVRTSNMVAPQLTQPTPLAGFSFYTGV